MGPGREAYSRFGHSAVRIRNLLGETDLVFNFGTFDDEAPDAVRQFLEGRLKYWLSVDTFRETREEYRREGRRMWAQELALAPAERRHLFGRLRYLARKENRAYRYHHYDANCSTRIRDTLDQALGGLLARQLRGRPAATHRHWLRRATRGAPLFHLAFDLVLTRSDRPIDRWEACFAPEQLMRGVALLRREGPGGAGPLVTRTSVLLPGPGFGEGSGVPPWIFVCAAALFLALVVAGPPLLWPGSTRAWRVAAVGLCLSGLGQAAMSGAVIGLEVISRVTVFRGNQNLVLVPPTVVFWLVAGIWLLVRPPVGRTLPRPFVWLAALQIIGIVVYLVSRFFLAYPQGNAELALACLCVDSASMAAFLVGRSALKSAG